MHVRDSHQESARTPAELASELGARLRELRLAQSLTQQSVAARAGISKRALQTLESGEGSTVDTLLRVLKALDQEQAIELLAPRPTISPLDMINRRAGRSRGNR